VRVVRAITPGHATIGIMVATILLVLVVVLVIAGLVFGVITLLAGDDPGLAPVDPDGRARPLPNDRSLHENDLADVRFDVALRGYRMTQVDRVLRRTAYDLGYKDEMIAVLEAEVAALREGRLADAAVLREAREAALSPDAPPVHPSALIPVGDERVPDFGDGQGGDAVADLDEPVDLEGAGVDEARTDTAEEPEPREGSLRRRNPVPDPSALLATPEPLNGTAPPDRGQDNSALEVADRPAHA
jgi:DivIVA domain-containing protein